MRRFTSVQQIPADFGETTVAIGNFDGVHRGHQAMLATVVSHARQSGRRAVAVTFWPHPLHVHVPDGSPQLITGLSQRLELLESMGVDATLVIDYTLEFAQQSPDEFVERYFVDALQAKEVVVGPDVRFGWQNVGDVTTMIQLGEKYDFSVTVQAMVSEDGGRRCSSSWARDLLTRGDVTDVAEVLGRSHTVRGVVVHGFKRGRELGFPTANLGDDMSGMIPGDGVYSGWLVRADGQRLPAAISVGTNPTFANKNRSVEAHVLDRDDLDLYDENVTFEFVKRLRANVKFDGLEELIDQMHRDVDHARAQLGLSRQD